MKSIYKSPAAAREIHERYLKILSRWPVANEQLRVHTRLGDTFVIVCGPEAAPPVVLLHGANSNSASWISDVALWAGHYRVYAVDAIGDPGFSGPSRPSVKSDAYSDWLSDVMAGLGLEAASFIGVSNGGWLALNYAIRFPERVNSLAVFCPPGIIRARNFLLKLFFLRMRKNTIARIPDIASPAQRYLTDFNALLCDQVRPRKERHGVFTDEQLQRLSMPLLLILGGKDAEFDSAAIRRRVEHVVPHAEIRYIAEAGHYIPGQKLVVYEFLERVAFVKTLAMARGA